MFITYMRLRELKINYACSEKWKRQRYDRENYFDLVATFDLSLLVNSSHTFGKMKMLGTF